MYFRPVIYESRKADDRRQRTEGRRRKTEDRISDCGFRIVDLEMFDDLDNFYYLNGFNDFKDLILC